MKKLFVFIGIASGVTLAAFLVCSIVWGLLVGLVALFGLALIAVLIGPMHAQRRMEEAEALYEARNYSAALKKLKPLSGWRREDELNVFRAKIYFRQNEDELCLETLEEVKDERYAVTKLYLASTLHALNNRQAESEEAYERLCKLLSDKKAKFAEDSDEIKRMKRRLDLLMKARDPREGEAARRKLLQGSRDKRMIEYLASVAVESTPLYSAMPQGYPMPYQGQAPAPMPAPPSGSNPFVPPNDDV